MPPANHVIVLDFESTLFKHVNAPEVMEIAGVVRYLKTGLIHDDIFHEYFKPTEYPVLSSGITQQQVNSGIRLAAALKNSKDGAE